MSNWILKFKPALEKIHSFKELFYLFVQHEIDTQFHSKYLDYGYYILNSNIYHHFSLLIGKNENRSLTVKTFRPFRKYCYDKDNKSKDFFAVHNFII